MQHPAKNYVIKHATKSILRYEGYKTENFALKSVPQKHR